MTTMLQRYTEQQARLPASMTREQEIAGCANKLWIAYPIEGDREEVGRTLANIEQRLLPGPAADVLAIVADMLEHYGKTGDIEPEIFTRHTDEFSAFHVAAQLAAHMRQHQQLPMPAELMLDLRRRQSTATVMGHRARVLLGLEEPHWYETPEFAKARVRKQRFRMTG